MNSTYFHLSLLVFIRFLIGSYLLYMVFVTHLKEYDFIWPMMLISLAAATSTYFILNRWRFWVLIAGSIVCFFFINIMGYLVIRILQLTSEFPGGKYDFSYTPFKFYLIIAIFLWSWIWLFNWLYFHWRVWGYWEIIINLFILIKIFSPIIQLGFPPSSPIRSFDELFIYLGVFLMLIICWLVLEHLYPRFEKQ